MLTVPRDQSHRSERAEEATAASPRRSWRQRLFQMAGRFLAPYEDLPPHLFATEEYLQLTGTVRRSGCQNPRPFD